LNELQIVRLKIPLVQDDPGSVRVTLVLVMISESRVSDPGSLIVLGDI
jgi:hypothetical protein